MVKRKMLLQELEKIRAANGGRLRPKDVIRAARNPKHPLHDQFTWDVAEAAGRYWLIQARRIIKVVYVVQEDKVSTVHVPYYIRDPEAEPHEQGYRPVVVIRDDRTIAMEALRGELRRAITLLDRAVSLAEELGLGEEVRTLLDRVEILNSRLVA